MESYDLYLSIQPIDGQLTFVVDVGLGPPDEYLFLVCDGEDAKELIDALQLDLSELHVKLGTFRRGFVAAKS